MRPANPTKKTPRSSVCHQHNTAGDNTVIPESADPCTCKCHMTEEYLGESILPKPAEGIPAGMDHSQRGCGDIRHDQTEVLSPNATVNVQGGRTIKDGVPAGGSRIDNQLLIQPSSCRLQEIRTFGLRFLHQLIMLWLPAARSRLNHVGDPFGSHRAIEGRERGAHGL